MPINSQNILSLMLLLLVATLSVVVQAARPDDELLQEEEYRSDLEEVVVRAQQPKWRESQTNEQQWRPDKFELPEAENKGRIEFFPKYTKDERDQYNGVRDRMGEKPEIKLFEWKF